MFRDQIGYRHADGGLRGYVGYGSSPNAARVDAAQQIQAACKASGEECALTGPAMRVVVGTRQCHTGEFKALRRQWQSIRKAKKDAGASIY